MILRRVEDFGTPRLSKLQLAERFVEALARKRTIDLRVKNWREYESAQTTLGPSADRFAHIVGTA